MNLQKKNEKNEKMTHLTACIVPVLVNCLVCYLQVLDLLTCCSL